MIVVWFSCGVASAVAAKKTIERYGQDTDGKNVRVVYSLVAEEDADNLRFLKDVERWIGHPIDFATNKKYPSCSAVEVWDKRKFMSGPKGAPCTVELKKEARYQWENAHKHYGEIAHVLGFTADEIVRHKRFIRTETDKVIPVLIDAGITKANCFEIIKAAGIQRPRVYDMGYPNANCIGCVKATSPTYWNLVREKHPEVFASRAEQSRRIGAKLVRVQNERIFLDELKPTDQGRELKNWDCGIFCEEPQPKGAEESE